MLEKLRRIPHPEYGHYCGFKRRCKTKESGECPMPVDEVDAACLIHDGDKSVLGDWRLAWNMLKVNPIKNTNYAKPIYARAYQYGAASVFLIIGSITAPYRGLKKLFK